MAAYEYGRGGIAEQQNWPALKVARHETRRSCCLTYMDLQFPASQRPVTSIKVWACLTPPRSPNPQLSDPTPGTVGFERRTTPHSLA